jgi:hypothetical protein
MIDRKLELGDRKKVSMRLLEGDGAGAVFMLESAWHASSTRDR